MMSLSSSAPKAIKPRRKRSLEQLQRNATGFPHHPGFKAVQRLKEKLQWVHAGVDGAAERRQCLDPLFPISPPSSSFSPSSRHQLNQKTSRRPDAVVRIDQYAEDASRRRLFRDVEIVGEVLGDLAGDGAPCHGTALSGPGLS